MEVLIRADRTEASILAARIVARQVRARPSCVLGLATGNTPLLLYRELVRCHRDEGLDFQQVTTFNLDEYVGLDTADARSYSHYMRENLFRDIDIDPARTHIPNGNDPHLRTACRRYEEAIAEAGGIDLQLLGLGRNGHIGFNEPIGSLASRTWLKILSRETIAANAGEFGSPDEVPSHVITMGIGTILDAAHCLLVAFGEHKAEAVRQMIEGPVTSMCPASALQLHQRTTVVLDDDAAAALTRRDHYRWVESQKLDWQRY